MPLTGARPEIVKITHGIWRDVRNYLESSRVVIHITEQTEFEWFTLTGPPRLVFDFSPAAAPDPSGSLPLDNGLVRAVRWAQHPGRRVRVVLDLVRPAPHRAFWLTSPTRLVVDVDRIEVAMYDHEASKLRVLPLDEYLTGVLAAEMPASFQLEALKAQAVAARTYTLRRLRTFGGPGCSAHPGADVCSDPSHCQGYASDEALRDRWREDYDRYRERLAGAVASTRRLFVTHGGGAADTVYHSTCGGHTASAEEVWGRHIPYLRGVPCEYCEISPHYRRIRTFSFEEVGQGLGVNLASVAGTTPSGRAAELTLGGERFAGGEVSARLGLGSTFVGDVSGEVALTVRGLGHGVGLCQWGAEGQARLGRSCREILSYYYEGASITGVRFAPSPGGGGPGSSEPEPGPEPGPGDPDGSPPPVEPPEPAPVVVIDPGHGGRDPGATGPGGLAEKDINLAVSLAAAEVLAGRVDLCLTRRTDQTVSLRARADLANSEKAAVFLSVHCNGSIYPEANGTETYHYPGSRLGTTLANLVHKRLMGAVRRRDRGVKEAEFYVLEETVCPAVLAEILFITNPEEAAILSDPEFQRRVGGALAAGILDYLEQVR